MPTHAERRLLPYNPRQLFDLVADIERYPEFLPWCVGVRVLRRDGAIVNAELMVGFKMIREKFTSEVRLQPHSQINVRYLDGPFRHLVNQWIFEPHPHGCTIDFHIDFEFRSRLMRTLMEPLFHEAVRRMVHAFDIRAGSLYGAPASAMATKSN